MIEVGKPYWIRQVNHRIKIGVVVNVTPGTVVLDRCIQIVHTGVTWTEFLAKGIATSTRLEVFGDGIGAKWIEFGPWPHEIPGKRQGARS